MKKQITLTLLGLIMSAASFALDPIRGITSACVGATSTLSDTTTGGTWSSSDPSIASVGLSTGVVTGISAGTATITYTLGTYVTTTFTVAATPGAISGTTTLCAGTTSTLSNPTPGGTWTCSPSYIATIDPVTGVLSAHMAGYATVYYNTGTSCTVSASITVNDTRGGMIVGPSSVCVGDSVSLFDSSGFLGGTWSSSDITKATVDIGGMVTGVSGGSVVITFTTSGPCGTAISTHPMTITTTTSPGTISGPSTVVAGGSITLTESVSGGTWSSSNTAIATIGATSGIMTGVTAGTAIMSYTVSGCSGLASATYPVTVTAFSGISGNVNFTGVAYYGAVKVWLIKYNPSTFMLSASDSQTVYSSGTSAHYSFSTAVTDSYRVKAAVIDSIMTGTGYIPTYHANSFYWHDATVINHVAGVGDINKDIAMDYGTTTSGPGFIAGDVTTGANKGTSGSPAVGLKMYVINSTTNQLIQQTVTDASGHYSFSNLPVGATYKIFPEALSYLTFAYTSIDLTSGAPSMAAASFIQHTISKTITPIFVGVRQIKSVSPSVATFPNPTTGKLNVSWETNKDEAATVVVTDVTGREVYTTSVNMAEGAGMTQLDLNNLGTGLYMISIKSASINYNNKIQIVR